MSKLKYQPYRAREGRATLCLLLALAAALCGVFLTLATQKKTALPYAQTQLKAAERMAEAERALYDYVRQNDIPIEKDDLNDTGLIGPEWTELTTSLGLLEAKRTALQPDFAALLVKYYQEAGLQLGDTVFISGAWHCLDCGGERDGAECPRDCVLRRIHVRRDADGAADCADSGRRQTGGAD